MNNYDIVLVAHEKDFNNLKFIVEYAEKNLTFDSIHLILSERKPFNDLPILQTLTSKKIFYHRESEVLKVDKTKIKHRPNWIYQMLLKMFQNVTENENFLIIESDCVILNPISFFESDKTIFYLCRDQNHEPYFLFNKETLGIGRELNHSFICEFMMYNKTKVNKMLESMKCKNVYDFLQIIYDKVDQNCYLADYEMYGNFCYKFFPEEFIVKKIDYGFYGRESSVKEFWDDNEIKFLISTNQTKPVISFHTWGQN